MRGTNSRTFLRHLLRIKPNNRLLVLALFFAANIAVAQNDLEIVVQKGHSGLINSMAFSRDGRFLVTGGTDQLVKLWDLTSGREIRTFAGHDEAITDVVIDVEENIILSAAGNSRGSEIFTWNLHEQDREKRIKAGHGYNLFKGTLEWSFEIKTLALGKGGDLFWGEDHLGVQVGKVSQSRGNDVLPTHWQPNHIAMSPNDALLAAGGDASFKRIGEKSNEIRLWNYPSLQPLHSLVTPGESVNRIKFSLDSKSIAGLSTQLDTTSNIYSNVVSIYETSSGQKITDISLSSTAELFDFAYSPDGKLMAVPLSNGLNVQVNIIDVATEKIIDTLDTDEKIINRLDFSPDGELLVACGSTINFWDVPTFKEVREIRFPQRITNFWLSDNDHIVGTKHSQGKQLWFDLDLSTIDYLGVMKDTLSTIASNGNSFISSHQGSSTIVQSKWTNRSIKQLLDKIEQWSAIESLELSESGKVWAAIGDTKEVAYGVDGNEVKFLSGHKKKPICIAISEESNLIATGGEDNKVLLWDLKTGQKLKEFVGHNDDIKDLDFNPGGTLLASGSEDWNVKLWDVKSKTLVKTLLGHQSDVLTIDFNESGELLASGSGDETFGGKSEVIIWDVKKRKRARKFTANDGYVKKLVFKKDKLYSMGNDPTIQVFEIDKFNKVYSFVPVDQNDFTIFTPEYFYTTTKMPEPFVHFVQELKVIHFENFDLKYNRPDLILDQLGAANATLKEAMYTTYQKRLSKLGMNEELLTSANTLPEVTILEKSKLPLTVNNASFQFTVEMTAPKSSLNKLNVWVNNIPIYGSGGLPLQQSETIKTIGVELNSGRNVIDVSCNNMEGVESYKESFEIVNLQEEPSMLHLIVVGVSEYANESLNLTYASKDAKDMASFFKQSSGFSDVVVHELLNGDVHIDKFMALKEHLKTSDVNDQVILFMAGHGVLDENFDFNFAAHNIDINDPSENGISFNMIENLMDSIPARKKLVLIDACHSGAIDKEEIDEVTQKLISGSRDPGVVKAKDFSKLRVNAFKHFGISNNSVAMMEQMFNDLGNGTGAVIISAAAGNSYALESSEWNNGVFTYSVLKGLKTGEADLDGNGAITVTELKEYVSESVFELTDGKQRSTSRKENYKLDFVVIK